MFIIGGAIKMAENGLNFVIENSGQKSKKLLKKATFWDFGN